MWIFGYGSLVWKVDFPVKRKVVGYITSHIRRFYQASTDHRGVPGKPGRVVTILPSSDPNDIVWGVAYEIAPENVDNVLNHLDYREKCGYVKTEVLFYPKQEPEKPFKLFIYVGGKDNNWFLGEAKIEEIAKQIAESIGPSGANSEYLFQLATAMRELAPECKDSHLFELEAAVKKIVAKSAHPVCHG